MPDLRSIVKRMVDAGESEQDIAAVIQRLSTQSTPTPESTTVRVMKGAGHAAVDTAKMIASASGIPGLLREGVPGALTDQFGLVKGLVDAQVDQYRKAKQDEASGNTSAMIGHSLAAAIPVLGPMAARFGEAPAAGRIPEAIGEALVLGGTAALPKVLPKAFPRPALNSPANAKDAAAVTFAEARGIPLDAGTRTGSQFIKNVQKKVGSSYGGANTVEAMQGAQAEHLARVGGELSDATGATVTNPVAAGESVRKALTTQIQNAHTAADAAYGKVRQGSQGASIDLVGFKQQIKPIYERLARENELVALQGPKGKALVTLDRLMNGPDAAAFADVDAALGDLKALSRGADMPELRNQGQGIASFAVQKLDAQVRAAAAKSGSDILKALEEGRAATKRKYATADVLDMLSGEPGQVFRQLTQSKDVGLERLRAVQRLAPKEMPNVARAFLEDMLSQATAEGGFTHADRLWSNWQKLGSETKQALFPKKGQIADLDNFFLLAKRIKENPNPSGTAQVMNATNLLMGIPSWALSKMLMTPQGVKALTTSQVALKSPVPAARAFAVSQVIKAAQSSGIPPAAIPALAAQQSTDSVRQSGRPQ